MIKLYSQNEQYKLYEGNMLEMLDIIDENSVDVILTDPPYELGFMGKLWDSSGIAYQKETWEKCLRVLKPGGHMVVFGGSRTHHRVTCAIEDAGFEIRDTIMYLYGNGFPKSLNIGLAIDKKNGVESKVIGSGKSGVSSHAYQSEETTTAGEFEIKEAQNEWNGWGTQLKPAYEAIILARKPVEGIIVDNVLKYGVGGLNIDECRVGNESVSTHKTKNGTFAGGEQGRGSIHEEDGGIIYESHSGRFPANIIHDGSDEAIKDMPIGGKNGSIDKPYKINNQVYGEYGYCKPWEAYNDEGSASRYFYCAKKSNRDRELGTYGFCFDKGKRDSKPMAPGYDDVGSASRYFYCAKASPLDRNEGLVDSRNIHSTVKPVELMEYLVKLVTPKNGTILDPFNGSGSTGKAVMWQNKTRDANYKYIGIELNEEYLAISKCRIEYISNNTMDFILNAREQSETERAKIEKEKSKYLDLFGGIDDE